MTTLTRLHGKGAVAREQSGRAYAYFMPNGPEAVAAAVAAHRMLRLLEAGDDKAGVLMRFVADLSPADERMLTELLTGSAAPEREG
jgi:predicted transcriptional regulator